MEVVVSGQNDQGTTPEEVEAELQCQPVVRFCLAENALTVARNLRDNYFMNTVRFMSNVRTAIRRVRTGQRDIAILETTGVDGTCWNDVQGNDVTFMDGGVGRVEIARQLRILLRIG